MEADAVRLLITLQLSCYGHSLDLQQNAVWGQIYEFRYNTISASLEPLSMNFLIGFPSNLNIRFRLINSKVSSLIDSEYSLQAHPIETETSKRAHSQCFVWTIPYIHSAKQIKIKASIKAGLLSHVYGYGFEISSSWNAPVHASECSIQPTQDQ